jgi:hypothetical protein
MAFISTPGSNTNGNIAGSSPASGMVPTIDQNIAGWLQEISQIAAGIGQQVYNWGQGVYNQVNTVTDANIARYLDTANQGGGLASSILNQYENVAAPEYNALVAEANQYAGVPFTQQQMGEAEATQAQAGDAARQNLIQQLQSYGIDPSSGRYAGLEAAENTATGAAEAAAGTQSALATKAQGQQLLTNAVQAGQQLPGAAVNALNSELQGIAGAENSELGAANTGVNIQDAAAPYLNAAMGLKYPPTAPVSGSANFGAGQNNKAPQTPAGQSGNPQPADNSYAYSSKGGPNMQPGPQAQTVSAPGAGGARGNANAQAIPVDTAGGQNPFSDPLSASQDPLGGAGLDPFAPQKDPFSQGQNPTGEFSPPIPTGQDPLGDTSGGGMDNGMLSSPYSPAIPSGQDPLGDTSGGGMDNGYQPPDQGQGYIPPDMSGSGDMSGGDSGFAGGGAIPGHATTGGHVPAAASPSQGRQTDDIHANLNAGEFVIPKDIAEWKGQEFFHNLIAQSRDKRMKAQAALGIGGKMKPQAPGPVTFRSQAMG